MMKTKAAIAFEPGQALEVLEIDLEGPKAGEVLVEMEACGICHTDVHSASGAEAWRKFPFVPGHEGCGIVREVGKGVTLLAPGDKVIPLYKSECGQCMPCVTGKSNNCAAIMPTQKLGVLMDGTSRFFYRGKSILHFMGCSAFSQFTVAPEISFAKISGDAPADEICLLGCAVTTGLGAVLKTAQVKAGSSVAIFGLGGIGLAAIQGARIAGAKRIIAVDLNAKKFDLALKFGATDVINPCDVDGSVAELIMEMTKGGCDYTFEAAGAIAAMQEAISASHPLWGVCCILGNTPDDARLSIHPSVVLGGRKIMGCTFGGVQGRSELPDYVDRAVSGELDLAPLVTHRLKLDEINQGIEMMRAGESIRSVIQF